MMDQMIQQASHLWAGLPAEVQGMPASQALSLPADFRFPRNGWQVQFYDFIKGPFGSII